MDRTLHRPILLFTEKYIGPGDSQDENTHQKAPAVTREIVTTGAFLHSAELLVHWMYLIGERPDLRYAGRLVNAL